MKELNGIKLRIRLLECLQLAILTPCLALPPALFLRGEDPLWLPMALGTIVPVQLIRLVCDKVEKKLPRALLSLAALGLAIPLTLKNDYWICYLLTGVPMLVSGLFLPRSKGRQVFTVPTPIALLPIVLVYALGKIVPEQKLCVTAVVLAALNALDYLLYLDQTRLLSALTMALHTKAEVSVRSIVRRNLRTVAAYLAAGLLVVVLVPILMAPREHAPADYSNLVWNSEETEEPTPTPRIEYEHKVSEQGFALPNLDPIVTAAMLVFAAAFIGAAVVGAVYLARMLLGSLEKKRREGRYEDEGMTIERQRPEEEPKKRERLTGYEKRIRRGYERLIKSRAPEKTPLAALTPTELEQTAALSGSGAETVHRIYCRTRYGEEPATRESFNEFRDAVRECGGRNEAD